MSINLHYNTAERSYHLQLISGAAKDKGSWPKARKWWFWTLNPSMSDSKAHGCCNLYICKTYLLNVNFIHRKHL